MATSKNKKSRVSKQAKKSKFQFKWWMGVIIAGVVIVVGLVVVRFSFAGTAYDIKIDDSTTARDKFYLTLYNQGSSVRGSITRFQDTPYYTEWRMQLNNGLVACGRIYNDSMKDIKNPSLPTTAKWYVTNPSCTKS